MHTIIIIILLWLNFLCGEKSSEYKLKLPLLCVWNSRMQHYIYCILYTVHCTVCLDVYLLFFFTEKLSVMWYLINFIFLFLGIGPLWPPWPLGPTQWQSPWCWWPSGLCPLPSPSLPPSTPPSSLLAGRANLLYVQLAVLCLDCVRCHLPSSRNLLHPHPYWWVGRNCFHVQLVVLCLYCVCNYLLSSRHLLHPRPYRRVRRLCFHVQFAVLCLNRVCSYTISLLPAIYSTLIPIGG